MKGDKIAREPRKHLIYSLKVTAANGESFTGRLVDISRHGLKMLAKAPLHVGDRVKVEVTLPEEIEGRTRILCQGRTVWCWREANPDCYSAGLEIEGGDETDAVIIGQIMKDYGA